MKKKTIWLLLILLAVSVMLLFGYIALDRLHSDYEAPMITMDAAEITLSVQDPQAALLQGVTAWDVHDGNVTASLVVESVYGITADKRATVTYAAFDAAGNVTKAQRQVFYADYVSPRLTLSGPLVFEYGSVFDVLSFVSAEDVFDGDLQRRVKATMITSGTSVTEEGNHEVLFRVTNSLGDTTQLVLPVEVYPTDSYRGELTLTDYMIYLPKGAEFDRDAYPLAFQARNESFDLRSGTPDGLRIHVAGKVDPQTPGLYTLTYTATYNLDGQAYTGYTRLFVVVEE